MNKDKALEELFLAHKPHFDDSGAFMASLTKRLDAVEYIKQHQEATIRRYKFAMVLALVVGIISGGIAMAFILSTPVDVPLISLKTNSALFLWLIEHSRLIVVTVVSLLLTCGLISLVNSVQDIMDMRTCFREIKQVD